MSAFKLRTLVGRSPTSGCCTAPVHTKSLSFIFTSSVVGHTVLILSSGLGIVRKSCINEVVSQLARSLHIMPFAAVCVCLKSCYGVLPSILSHPCCTMHTHRTVWAYARHSLHCEGVTMLQFMPPRAYCSGQHRPRVRPCGGYGVRCLPFRTACGGTEWGGQAVFAHCCEGPASVATDSKPVGGASEGARQGLFRTGLCLGVLMSRYVRPALPFCSSRHNRTSQVRYVALAVHAVSCSVMQCSAVVVLLEGGPVRSQYGASSC